MKIIIKTTYNSTLNGNKKSELLASISKILGSEIEYVKFKRSFW